MTRTYLADTQAHSFNAHPAAEPSSPLMQTYSPLPVSFVSGKGTRLWDQSGVEYQDAVAGIAVTNVGHSHPRITQAIQEQAHLLLHTSNHYSITWQHQLAERLTQLSGMQRVFFGNSGSEANEAAFKLARRYAHRQGISEPKVVVMENAFHGRSLTMTSASNSPSVRNGFGPLINDFIRVPFGDVKALETITRQHSDQIVAVLVEPIQGEAGVITPPPGYLTALREYCTRQGWLLMLDEIQTGMGRTGAWFAYQHEGIQPDVVTLAKALANGLPIGACLASGSAAELFTPGSHGSTFGGNPLACRVGCTVLDIIEEEGLIERAAQQGKRLKECLEKALSHLPHVQAIRGAGLLIGIQLDKPCQSLMRRALDNHRLLINVTRGNTIRLLPPLVISEADIDSLVHALYDLITQEQ
jgi:acetylornithine aminotransferase